MSRLNEKHSQLTRRLVLEAATDLLEEHAVDALSMATIAEAAGISERTIYRHFESRAVLLDALTEKLHGELQLPPVPDRAQELIDTLPEFYRRLEAKARIVEAMLNSEIYPRVLENAAGKRLQDIIALLNAAYPDCSKAQRMGAAYNIRYYMSASTWHYFRNNFGLSLKLSIEYAQAAIRPIVQGLEAGQ